MGVAPYSHIIIPVASCEFYGLPQIRIPGALVANGSGGAVTRIHNGVVGQGEQFCMNRFHQQIEIAAGEIGAANAAVEQYIAGDHHVC